MSYTITPVKEKDVQNYKITPIEKMLDGLLPDKGYQNRELTIDELWIMGLTMIKVGFLLRFRIRGDKGDLVRMGYPE